jgi:hypothetical protein
MTPTHHLPYIRSTNGGRNQTMNHAAAPNDTVAPLPIPPGFWLNLLTFGIARARWTAAANRQLGSGAGFWFAWLLLPFANYGIAGRLNEASAAAGSAHRESPLLCFFLTGVPFIGAKRRVRRAVVHLNDALRVRSAATAQSA